MGRLRRTGKEASSLSHLKPRTYSDTGRRPHGSRNVYSPALQNCGHCRPASAHPVRGRRTAGSGPHSSSPSPIPMFFLGGVHAPLQFAPVGISEEAAAAEQPERPEFAAGNPVHDHPCLTRLVNVFSDAGLLPVIVVIVQFSHRGSCRAWRGTARSRCGHDNVSVLTSNHVKGLVSWRR